MSVMMSPRCRNAAVTAMTALGLLALISSVFPRLPLWITDNGNKYIVMRNFAEYGTTAIKHPAPEFFPDGNFHFVCRRGEIRSFYPEYYPVLASYPFRWFGERSVIWLSMLGSAVSAGLLALIMKRRFPAAGLLVFATPLFFFSFLLWEMSWGVCFAAAAWLLLLNKKHFPAGVVLGASLLLREEAYFLVFAFAAALLGDREVKSAAKTGAGFICAAFWIWVYQYIAFGHIFGLHGGTYYLNNLPDAADPLARQLRLIPWNYWHHLLRFAPFGPQWANLLCLVPIIGAAAAGALTDRKWNGLKRLLAVAALTGWGALIFATVAACRDDNIAFRAAGITGLIATNPLFLPFYLNWRRMWLHRNRAIRLSARTAAIYILLVPPLLTVNDIGLIYGARHFLAVMPMLLFLSLRGAKNAAAPRLIPAMLSVVLQCAATLMLIDVSAEAAEMQSAVWNTADSGVIVTDAFFLPEQTPQLFFGRTVFKLDDGNVDELIAHLRRQREHDITLVLSNRYRNISDAGVLKLLAAAPPMTGPIRFNRKPGSGFMDIYILRCRLK